MMCWLAFPDTFIFFRCKVQPAILCRSEPSKAVNLNPCSRFLLCATCNKDSGFYSPFPGVSSWVCSSECGQRLPALAVGKKVLIGSPATGLGLLSSTVNHPAPAVSADAGHGGAEGAPRLNPTHASNPSCARALSQNESIREAGHDSAADCIKLGLESSTPADATMKTKKIRKKEVTLDRLSNPVGSKSRGLISEKDPSSGTTDSELICTEQCFYSRSPNVNYFMVECCVCNKWFHGKCMRVCKRDVAGKDVVWVCSADCEEDLPFISKVGKQLLVGSSSSKKEDVSTVGDMNKVKQREHLETKNNKDPLVHPQKTIVEMGEVCMEGCRYNRVLKSTHFSIRCSGCERIFHGKCANVLKRDVSQGQVTWVCSEGCVVKVPPLSCSLQKLLVGATRGAHGLISRCSAASDSGSDSPGNAQFSAISQPELFCIEQCKYQRSSDADRFMVECEGCKRWFHGKCMRVSEQDVASEDVLWVCSADCEDDLPVGTRTGKEIIVASTRTIEDDHNGRAHLSPLQSCCIDELKENQNKHDEPSDLEQRQDRLVDSLGGGLSPVQSEQADSSPPVVDEIQEERVIENGTAPCTDLETQYFSEDQSLQMCIDKCKFKRRCDADTFMVECSGCQRWFHGKCVRVKEPDVTGEDVIWACTAGCQDNIPAAEKDGKRLLVGPTAGDVLRRSIVKDPAPKSSDRGDSMRKRKPDPKSPSPETEQVPVVQTSETCESNNEVPSAPKFGVSEHSKTPKRKLKDHHTEERTDFHADSIMIRSKDLARFMGVQECSESTRTAVNSFVLQYIHRCKLLDKTDASYCILDKKLGLLLGLTGRCKLKRVAKKIRCILDDSSGTRTPEPHTPVPSFIDASSTVQAKRHKACLFGGVSSSALVADTKSGEEMADDDDDVPLFASAQKPSKFQRRQESVLKQQDEIGQKSAESDESGGTADLGVENRGASADQVGFGQLAIFQQPSTQDLVPPSLPDKETDYSIVTVERLEDAACNQEVDNDQSNKGTCQRQCSVSAEKNEHHTVPIGALPDRATQEHLAESPMCTHINATAGDSREVKGLEQSSRLKLSDLYVEGSTLPETADCTDCILDVVALSGADPVKTTVETCDVAMPDADTKTQECESVLCTSDSGFDDDEEDVALLDLLESKLVANSDVGCFESQQIQGAAVDAGEEQDEISLEELEMLEASIAAGIC